MSAATAPQRSTSASACPSPGAAGTVAAFRRIGSGASVAQSFFDVDGIDPSGSMSHLSGMRGRGGAVAATCVASPSPMPQLRPLHGRVRSNTQQDFLSDATEEVGEAKLAAPPSASTADARAPVMDQTVAAAAGTLPRASPSPAPVALTTGVDALRDCVNERVPHLRGANPDFVPHSTTPHATLNDFTQQYAQSSNPYLRAAANEVRASSDDRRWVAEMSGYGGAGVAIAAASGRTTDVNAGSCELVRDDESGGFPFSAAAHKVPQLTRPVAQHRRSKAPHAVEAFTPSPFSTQHFTPATEAVRPAPGALRGIPLFTRSQPASRLSGAPSLRQSLEDYGQMQLQGEAVRWSHRCAVLEQTVAQLQAAYERQSALLAAQWHTKETGTAATAAATTAAATAGRTASSASPAGQTTALSSRSPDALSEAYVVECAAGEVTEVGDGAPAQEGSLSVHPTPSLSATGAPSGIGEIQGAFFSTRAGEESLPDSSQAARATVQRGGGVEAPRISAAARGAHRIDQPSSRSIAVQTETPGAEESVAFVREDGEGIHRAAVSTAGACAGAQGVAPSPPPTPSAIMAKQYAEAVEELEAMQVRLDAAEREAQNLRDECVAQDLRCDNLETQLLAKEEQLSRMAQPAGAHKGEYGESSSSSSSSEAETASGRATPLAPLKAAVAQLTEMLRAVDRVQREVFADLGGEEDADPTRMSTPPLLLASPENTADDRASVHADHVEETSDMAQLSSLVERTTRAVLRVSEQHAALHAELAVVRADRNELIGEQSEQVRHLQQQLLEKDTEQLRLMMQLEKAREAADGAPAYDKRETDASAGAASRACSVASGAASATDTGTGTATDRLKGCDVEGDGRRAAQVDEVALLKAQLGEARAAAAAAVETQHAVMTERLERVQAELRETRLRAEDEYDALSSTIERLTRQLADTREALRVKEMSLRIALCEASPALVMAASAGGDAASGPLLPSHGAVRHTSPLSEDAPRLTGSLAAVEPLPLRSTSPASYATDVGEFDGGDRRGDATPPSPLASPPPPLGRAAHTAASAGRQLTPQSARSESETSVARPLLRAEKFVDDGTLRSVPSLVPMEGGGGGDPAHFVMSTATIASSRGKSSRGLTTSTGGASHTTLSLPRDGSGGAVENPAALPYLAVGNAFPMCREESGAAAAAATAAADSVEALHEPHGGHDVVSDATSAVPASASPRQRKSASTRLVDRDGGGEEELPLPLRSPLFRSPSAASSPSPPHAAAAAVSFTSPVGRRASPSLHQSASLTPEERLRSFLALAVDDTGAAGSDDQGSAFHRIRTASTLAAASAHVAGDHAAGAFHSGPSARGDGVRLSVAEDGGAVTPTRTPMSLLSERTPASAASTPSSGFGASPRVREAAERHTLASLRRHRAVWQQQAALLHSLQSTPSS